MIEDMSIQQTDSELTTIVRYLPTWFPGASFQRCAQKCLALTNQMRTLPMQFVKEQMVSPLGAHFVGLLV